VWGGGCVVSYVVVSALERVARGSADQIVEVALKALSDDIIHNSAAVAVGVDDG
jgi:hypothetical protein